MAVLALLVMILAFVRISDASWCVCRSDVSDAALQKTLDYACGAGADCNPIHQGGACYDPNTVRSHCSYAANSYYQRKQSTGATCDFSGTATLANTDPSYGSCSFPASASAAGTGSGTGMGTPGIGTPGSSSNLTPPSMIGLGPSGFSPDGSDGGLPIMELARNCILSMALMIAIVLRF